LTRKSRKDHESGSFLQTAEGQRPIHPGWMEGRGRNFVPIQRRKKERAIPNLRLSAGRLATNLVRGRKAKDEYQG